MKALSDEALRQLFERLGPAAPVSHFYEGGDTDGGDGSRLGGVNGDGGNEGRAQRGESAGISGSDRAAAAQNAGIGGWSGPGYTSALGRLADAGQGDYAGLNTANPTQTVSQMQASDKVNRAFGSTVPGLARGVAGAVLGPIGMAAVGLGESIASGLSFGEAVTRSLGDTALNMAISSAAAVTGVPRALVAGIANGDVGNGVGAATVSAVNGALASAVGMNPSDMAALGNVTGLNSMASSSIAGAVGSAIGPTTGFNMGRPSLGNATASAGPASRGGGGGSGAGSMASPGSVNTAASTPSARVAQAAPSYAYTPQQEGTTLPKELDGIIEYYDPFGSDILHHRPMQEPVKSAQGRSVDDILTHLRS